jgi:hypothetical protein
MWIMENCVNWNMGIEKSKMNKKKFQY